VVKENSYQNKQILVLGMAKSGFHAARLLHDLGASVVVNDAKDLTDNDDAKALEALGVTVISGGHPDNLLADYSFDIIVKNPGIPYDNSLLLQASKKNIPIITEVEVATSVMSGYFIGLTGTNGKTTTTSMIQEMLQQDRLAGKAYAIGNIGVPASQVSLELTPDDDVVIELSSFQLMGTPTIKPKIAVLTNLYSAHLDYHGSQAAYEQAKMNLIQNQTAADVLIYNKDQPHLEELVLKQAKATLLPFSRKEFLEDGVSIKNETIYYKNEPVAETKEIFLEGLHNLENFLAAIAVAKLKGVSNAAIKEVLQQFRGVKHRTQYVTEFADRIFYNDSKATNIEATENALVGFSQPVVLLAGGLDRGNSFDALIPALKDKVKALVTFGETKDLMIAAANKAGVRDIVTAENVETAVPKAYALSEPGDVILLSPAAASWDQYENFEIRGEQFIKAVEQIVQQGKE
jgi:UDP-N-acetylmuramoylalanine--D-glutamate ligase